MLRLVIGKSFSYYTELFTIYGKKRKGKFCFLLLCRFVMCSFRLARHILLGIRDELGSRRRESLERRRDALRAFILPAAFAEGRRRGSGGGFGFSTLGRWASKGCGTFHRTQAASMEEPVTSGYPVFTLPELLTKTTQRSFRGEGLQSRVQKSPPPNVLRKGNVSPVIKSPFADTFGTLGLAADNPAVGNCPP